MKVSEYTIAFDYQPENGKEWFCLLPTGTALVEIGEVFRPTHGRNTDDLRDDQA